MDGDVQQRYIELKNKAFNLKKEIDYYNAIQSALKLVLNIIFGASGNKYFILYNKDVANALTAQGRDLTKNMDKFNSEYWYNIWHVDYELHEKLCIKNVSKINEENDKVGIYADTDSLFVSYEACLKSCEWKNLIFNKEYLNSINEKFIILHDGEIIDFENTNCIGVYNNLNDLKNFLKEGESLDCKLLLVGGEYIHNKDFIKFIESEDFKFDIKWNWSEEIDFILALDYYRIGKYFKECLEKYAEKYNLENREDFELERISESILIISKKKYIQNLIYEDGIKYERLSYILPKGVELIRSSTSYFAREKIMDIVKYIFSKANEDLNIVDLLFKVKGLRKEFELADINDISMQSSCSNYEKMVIDDKKLPLKFFKGTHFAVKASAYYNYLLYKNNQYQSKYDFIKSGTKVKYYYCKDRTINDVFAFIRGSFPFEFAPEIDYDEQFEKSILSVLNSIIEPLNFPKITKRLTVILDIFS